jgi:hypothetical protein
MDYIIHRTDPANGVFTIKPYTVNGSASPTVAVPLASHAVSANTSLILLGQGMSEYGEIVATDFVHLLENFSNPLAPVYPVSGQLWYKNDTTDLFINAGSDPTWATPLSVVINGHLHSDLNVNTHKITNVSDPVNPQDVVTLSYLGTHVLTPDLAVMNSGVDVVFSGGGKPTGLPAVAVGSTDATSKLYVDTQDISYDTAVRAWAAPKFVDVIGDTMTGTLIIDGLTSYDGLQVDVDKSNIDTNSISVLGDLTSSFLVNKKFNATLNAASGYQVVNVGGGKIPATSTGLANDGTVYSATVTINGAAHDVNIIGSAAQTYTDLLIQINDTTPGIGVAPFGVASLGLISGNLQIVSATAGTTSTVLIVDSTGPNPPLFATLTGFVAISPAVAGFNSQIGVFTTLSSSYNGVSDDTTIIVAEPVLVTSVPVSQLFPIVPVGTITPVLGLSLTNGAPSQFNGNFSVVGTHNINFGNNVLHGVVTPVAATDATNKQYVDDTATSMVYSHTVRVDKVAGLGNFTSIKAAIDSILDASSVNKYAVEVGPGVYIEPPFSLKSHVKLLSQAGYTQTFIAPTVDTSTVVTAVSASILDGFTVLGATGVGGKGVYFTPTVDGPQGQFIINNVRFQGNTTDLHIEGKPTSQDILFSIPKIGTDPTGLSPNTTATPGYQVVDVGGTTVGTNPTGLTPDAPAVAGYQVVDVGGAKIGTDPTGLVPATTYTASISVDGVPTAISILGSTAADYATLINEINTDLGVAATAALVGGNIKITSATTGVSSTVAITDTDLFLTLTGYVSLSAAVPGIDIVVTTYTASVAVDGVPVAISVDGGLTQTFADLINEINTDLGVAAVAALVGGNIKITSATTGITSTVAITDTNLFSTLTGYVAILAAVDGVDIIVTTYTATITISGTPFVISTNVNLAPTFADLIDIINTELGSAAVASLLSGNIHISSTTSTTDLASSSVLVVNSGTNHLFASPLADFSSIAPPYTGTTYVRSDQLYFVDSTNATVTQLKSENPIGGGELATLFTDIGVTHIAGSGTSMSESIFVTGSGTMFRINGLSMQKVGEMPTIHTNNSLGDGVVVQDGARVDILSGIVTSCKNNIVVRNVGAAPVLQVAVNLSKHSTIRDVSIEHPGTTGIFSGAAEVSKVFIAPTSTLSAVYNNLSSDGGTVIIGPLMTGPTQADLTDITELLNEALPTGLLEGGIISQGVNPLDINITAGYGYVGLFNTKHYMKKLIWPSVTYPSLILTLPDNTNNIIYVDSTGEISSSVSIPDRLENIILGRVRTAGGIIQGFALIPDSATHLASSLNLFNRDALGVIYKTGSLVSENVTPLHIDVTSGNYYYSTLNFHPAGGVNRSFYPWYDIAGVWTKAALATAVSNTQYNRVEAGYQDVTFTIPKVNGDATGLANDTAGYQIVNVGGLKIGTDPTGLTNDVPATAGYQIVNVGGAKIGTDPTGLVPATIYTASISVDGSAHAVSILGSTATTYADLLTQINADLAGTALPSLTGGNVQITSGTTGVASTVVITDTDLFSTLTGYVAILAPVGGVDVIITTYTASISVDGGASVRAVSINGGAAQTYATLITELIADSGSWYTAALTGGNIEITSLQPGASSAIAITDTGLFSVLTGYVSISAAVAGTHTAYTASIAVNGTPHAISVGGNSAQTFATLLSEINIDLGVNGVATLVGGNIRITSTETAANSTIAITDTNLFSTLTNYSSIAAAVNGGLIPLTAAHYTKHVLYVSGDGVTEQYALVYGEAEYATQLDAELAPLSPVPPLFNEIATMIATIIVKQGAANIVEIVDVRPRIGFAAPSITAVSTHGNLSGLLADDHPQYLRTDGTRSLTGNLSLGTHNLTNVGMVNGVTVETHASRHLPTGADALTTAAPSVNVSPSSTNTVGIANSLSRSDHNHALTGVGVLANPLSQFAATTSLQLAGVISDETGTGSLVFASGPTLTSPNVLTSLVLDKTSGVGIKVDNTTPTYPYRDIIGHMNAGAGATDPTLSTFIGGSFRSWAFAANDKIDIDFHVPHDYAPGTDLFLHYHWSHNGTAISGNIVATVTHTYAKGHNQASFTAEKTLVYTYNTVDIATTPRYIHRIEELQLSQVGGSATLLDTSLIEPDGMIGVSFTMTTPPTITGGAPNNPFVFFVDVHYQSTGIGTKQKSPNFYV